MPEVLRVDSGALLQRVTMEDGGRLHDITIQEAEHLSEWFSFADRCGSVRSSDPCVNVCVEAEAQFIKGTGADYWIMEDGSIQGCVDLRLQRGASDQWSSTYWLRRSAAGKGLATNGVGAAVELAFSALGATGVDFSISNANIDSQRVVQRLGADISVRLDEYDVWSIERE